MKEIEWIKFPHDLTAYIIRDKYERQRLATEIYNTLKKLFDKDPAINEYLFMKKIIIIKHKGAPIFFKSMSKIFIQRGRSI
jgi:hypothetical protein